MARSTEDILLASRCQRDYKIFIKEFWDTVPGVGPLRWNWHLSLLADELETVMRRVFKGQPKEYDLIVNLCFGTSKSMLCSVLLQPWAWTNMADCRFLSGTHTDSLVLDLSTRAKDVVKSEKYQRLFPHIKVRADRAAKEDWANTLGGERKCCTVGGVSPTGRHVYAIVIDDPIDPTGARSEAELETAKQFMNEVIPSRMVDKEVTPIILVMQRLHPRDPTFVMQQTARLPGVTPARQICLPGELCDGAAEVSPPLEEIKTRYDGRPDPFGNPMTVYEDGLMDKFRLSRRVLADYLGRLKKYGFSGQVLQNPVPPGGGRFHREWFSQTCRTAPYDCVRVRCWDRAATQGGGAATAGVLMARDKEGRLYVEDVVHGHWEPNERNDIIVATSKRDRIKYGPKNDPTVVVEAERGSTGMESFQHLARKLLGFRIREVKASQNKDARTEPWADQLSARNVWFCVEGKCTWDFEGFVEEHLNFMPDLTSKRMGGLKDRVDASAHAATWLAGNVTPTGAARVLAFRKDNVHDKRRLLRLVSCPPDMLEGLRIDDHPTLLVRVSEPGAEMLAANAVTVGGAGDFASPTECGAARPPILSAGDSTAENDTRSADAREGTGPSTIGPFPFRPVSNLMKNIDTLDLSFADLDPKDFQDKWDEPVPGKDKPVRDLIMDREHGKKLWAFVTKRRQLQWEAVVFVGPGGIPLSLARGVATGMGLREAEAVYDVTTGGEGGANLLSGPPPNQYIFDMTRSSRGMVV